MAIVITVEDGSIVANANSYVSLEEARAYAAQRAVDLPADDDALSALLVTACDYIGAFEPQFQGLRTSAATQSLAWPRKCVSLFGEPLADNVIPSQLKTAQIAAIVAASTGLELFPTQSDAAIKQETVGPLTTIYDTTTWNPDQLPSISTVNSALLPLLRSTSKYRTIRA